MTVFMEIVFWCTVGTFVLAVTYGLIRQWLEGGP